MLLMLSNSGPLNYMLNLVLYLHEIENLTLIPVSILKYIVS